MDLAAHHAEGRAVLHDLVRRCAWLRDSAQDLSEGGVAPTAQRRRWGPPTTCLWRPSSGRCSLQRQWGVRFLFTPATRSSRRTAAGGAVQPARGGAGDHFLGCMGFCHRPYRTPTCTTHVPRSAATVAPSGPGPSDTRSPPRSLGARGESLKRRDRTVLALRPTREHERECPLMGSVMR
ncbi:unnamed protein product [Merluccius merluccius]